MKQLIATIALLAATMSAQAQGADEKPFRAYLYNKEYDVEMHINFYDNDVVISWQKMFGELPGYLARRDNNFCWIVTSADIHDGKALLEMVNDYGSEDLTATLTHEHDSIYTLRQTEGSTLKVPKNGKWQKLPRTLQFVKRERRRHFNAR